MKKEIQVLATLDLTEDQRHRLREVSDSLKLTVFPTNNAEEVSKTSWAQTEVLYTWDALPDPDLAPNLQWVQFQTAGIDAMLGHPLLKKKDLIATTMSGVITGQVAEYVIMSVLALGHQLPEIFRLKRDQKWPFGNEEMQRLLPRELRHSTVGILGYGSIGRQVARLLQPFNARVLGIKRDVMHPEDTGYIQEGMGDPHGEFFDRLYPVEALHSFLKECDFVVVALPLTNSTQHLLNAEAFEVMKPTAYVVNVSRGGLVDQPALIQALKTKQIAGAALDVFDEEPLPKESPLWELPNVILSPHIAGISRHFNDETLTLFIENLNRYMAGLPLHNQVDVEKGY